MSNPTQRLLINLSIIGQVQQFQRLNAKSEMLGIEPNSWYTSLTRWLRGDERTVFLRRIGELVDEATKILNDDKDNSETKKKLKKRIATKLRASAIGLNNLRITYEDDVATKSHIDHIIENIDNLVGIENIDNLVGIDLDPKDTKIDSSKPPWDSKNMKNSSEEVNI